MQTEKIKFISIITSKITLLVNDLQNEIPGKEFKINNYEANTYWCINWKTDKYLKEYFQIQAFKCKDKYSLFGEHRIEDVLEQFSEEYFFYEEKTIEELLSITDDIIKKTKNAVIVAIKK